MVGAFTAMYALLLLIWVTDMGGLLFASYEIYQCEEKGKAAGLNTKMENEDFNVGISITSLVG